MKSFKGNIEKITSENNFYRKVLHTNKYQQLVVMNLKPFEEIGMEVHPQTSQFIKVEGGSGIAVVAGRRYNLKHGDSLVVDNNVSHNVKAGKNGLKLYTIYSPPEHKRGTKTLRKK